MRTGWARGTCPSKGHSHPSGLQIGARQECWPDVARAPYFSREERNKDFYVKI